MADLIFKSKVSFQTHHSVLFPLEKGGKVYLVTSVLHHNTLFIQTMLALYIYLAYPKIGSVFSCKKIPPVSIEL